MSSAHFSSVFETDSDFGGLIEKAENPTQFFPSGLLLNPKLGERIRVRCKAVVSEAIQRKPMSNWDENVILATSGSSLTSGPGDQGTPPLARLVILGRSQLEASARGVIAALEITKTDRLGLCLPLFHVGGLSIPIRARLAGASVSCFKEAWSVSAFQKWIQSVTVVSLVPTQIFDLVKAGVQAPSSLRVCLVGGGRLDPSVQVQAVELGWPIILSYGMTECGSTMAICRLNSKNGGGEPQFTLLPHVKARTGSGTDRLEVKTPALMQSVLTVYEDRFSVTDFRFGDWYLTEDRVALSGKSDLALLGRVGDVVKVLGELVDLNAVEREVRSVTQQLKIDFNDVSVVANPEIRRGYELIVFLEGKLSALDQEFELQTIKALIDQRLTGVQRIAEVHVIDRFPRTPLGKIIKAELAKLKLLKDEGRFE